MVDSNYSVNGSSICPSPSPTMKQENSSFHGLSFLERMAQ